MKNSRLIAFEVLSKIRNENAYSNLAIENSVRDLNSKDKAFVNSLVMGVIERKLTLDYLISRYLKTRVKPKVKTILYIGAYQLYFMDKVPSSAAINT
ncbi:MAG: 16S rRNA (cytosine(967)-C(5))-methyltransferase RsmB, partial [Eubacterium sp.]|nr:16S rRNA (cytosine(967)-C(5))-methyltransferase RsmB [Eubacterium sp.]